MPKKPKPSSKPKPTAEPPSAVASSPSTSPPGMVVKQVAIGELVADPRNARLHSEKNLAAIQASLKRFGQTKNIVLDADGIVIAGNGTMAAAVALGWTHLWANQTTLRGVEARAYALADNRTAELADWDLDELNATLGEIERESIDLSAVGFDEDALAALNDLDFEGAHGFAPPQPKDEKPPKEESITPTFKVIVTCATEAEHRRVIAWMEKQGIEYKAPSV